MEELAACPAAARHDGPVCHVLGGAKAIRIARTFMQKQTLARNEGTMGLPAEVGEYVVLEVFHAGEAVQIGERSYPCRVSYELEQKQTDGAFSCPLDGSVWLPDGPRHAPTMQDTFVSKRGTAWQVRVEWRAGRPDGQGTLF